MKRRAESQLVKTSLKRARITGTRYQRRKPSVSVPQEYKYTTKTVTGTQPTWTGVSESLLGNLVRGDAGKDNFDGNQIVPIGLTVRLTALAGGTSQPIRVIILQVIKGTVPLVTQLLDSTGGTTTTYLASYNRGYKPTVKILYDRIMNTSTADDDNESDVVYIPSKKLRRVEYITGTTNISTGDIRIYYYGSSGTGASLQYYSEVLYAD